MLEHNLSSPTGYTVNKNSDRSVTPTQYMALALRRVPRIFLDTLIKKKAFKINAKIENVGLNED